MTSEAACEAPVVPEGTLATVRWMTATSFWSWPFNCWSAVFASAAAERRRGLGLEALQRALQSGRRCLGARDSLRRPSAFVGFAATDLPAEVTAARHVTNALHTLFAHVEASAVAVPDVVVAAVVAADLFPDPQAAVREDDRNGGSRERQQPGGTGHVP